jgi:hypothetical protein
VQLSEGELTKHTACCCKRGTRGCMRDWPWQRTICPQVERLFLGRRSLRRDDALGHREPRRRVGCDAPGSGQFDWREWQQLNSARSSVQAVRQMSPLPRRFKGFPCLAPSGELRHSVPGAQLRSDVQREHGRLRCWCSKGPHPERWSGEES